MKRKCPICKKRPMVKNKKTCKDLLCESEQFRKEKYPVPKT